MFFQIFPNCSWLNPRLQNLWVQRTDCINNLSPKLQWLRAIVRVSFHQGETSEDVGPLLLAFINQNSILDIYQVKISALVSLDIHYDTLLCLSHLNQYLKFYLT